MASLGALRLSEKPMPCSTSIFSNLPGSHGSRSGDGSGVVVDAMAKGEVMAASVPLPLSASL